MRGVGRIPLPNRLVFLSCRAPESTFFFFSNQQKLRRERGAVFSEHLESKERIERLGIPGCASDISGSSDVAGLEKTS